MSYENRKPEHPDMNPAEIEKLLEIELMQKRAGWQQTKARNATLRGLSFLFLFLVILAALFGFYVFLSPDRMDELKASNSSQAQPTPTPGASSR